MTKKPSLMNLIISLFFVALLSSCGGGTSSDDDGETENISTESEYILPLIFAAYFNNTKSETQTTDEFNREQAAKLEEVRETKLLVETNRSGYEADTGYASFTLEFSYRENELFQGPSHRIYFSSNTTQSGSVSVTSQRYKYIVFTNEPEEFYLYSNDSLFSCENKYSTDFSLYKTTICNVDVMVDRENLYDYNFHLLFDINISTLIGYENSTSHSPSAISINSTTYEYLPVSKLNSISIIDPGTKTTFGTLFSQ